MNTSNTEPHDILEDFRNQLRAKGYHGVGYITKDSGGDKGACLVEASPADIMKAVDNLLTAVQENENVPSIVFAHLFGQLVHSMFDSAPNFLDKALLIGSITATISELGDSMDEDKVQSFADAAAKDKQEKAQRN